MLALNSETGFYPNNLQKGGQKMLTYYFAKARHEELLREAEQARLVREAKRAKRRGGKYKPAQTKGWANRRLHATRA